MTPQEQRKADAQMLLEDQPVVINRILQVINELFSTDKNSAANLRWLASQLIEGESPRKTRYGGIGHMESQPLASYIKQVIREEINIIVHEAVEQHVKQIDSRIRELNKLEKKGWFRP
jgi:ubiquinone biosynthesis protein UbiJ